MDRSGRFSMRSFWMFWICLLIALFAAGCGAGTKSEVPRTAPAPATKSAPQGASTDTASKSAGEPRKIIESAQIVLETRDLAATEKSAFELLSRRNGKVEQSSVSLDSNGRRSGNYTLRVPAGQLQAYVEELSALQDVVVRQRSLSAQDVTEDFVDISARLENMQRHEIRLREILSKANTVEEILKVEKELAAVRTQIESTTGRLRVMTGKIEMSAIQLRITEVTVITETNFLGKLKGILRDSWVAAGDVLLYLIAAAIVLSPLAALLFVLIWFWRNRQKRKAAVKPGMDPAKREG